MCIRDSSSSGSTVLAFSFTGSVIPAGAGTLVELAGDISELKIVETFADEAPTTKRFRARARGRANRINRRSSDGTVILE